MKRQLIASVVATEAGCNTWLKFQILLCLSYRPGARLLAIKNVLQRSLAGIHNCLTDLQTAGLVSSVTVPTGNRSAYEFTLTEAGEKILKPFTQHEKKPASSLL